MVPSTVVALESLPLTPAGKVDRAALPLPGQTRARGESIATPPCTDVERRLAAMWMELLGVDQVGREENFFALGGHSLLVTRIVSRIRNEFSVELPIRALFEQPTVGGLARLVAWELGKALPTAGEQPRSIPKVNGCEFAPDVDRMTDEEVDAMILQILTAQ
jgi:acyl carrier protein